jgi:hypothetical protein
MKIEDTYQNHWITHSVVTPRLSSWTLSRPGTGAFFARIVAAESLMITGDGPDLIFRGGPPGCLEKVRWCADASLDSLTRKLVAGPHSEVGLGLVWDEEVALEDLDDYLSGEHDPQLATVRNEWRGGSYHDWQTLMHEHVNDAFEYRFGISVSVDVALAREACRRLVYLLEQMERECN